MLASLLLAAAASPPAADAQGAENREGPVRAAVEAHRAASEAEVMEELRVLLAEPNLASDLPAIRRNAELLVAMLERRGVDARLLELEGKPPAVFGELRAPEAQRIVVLYAHYDGQPVDSAEWANPPWEPTLRNGRLEAGTALVPWMGCGPTRG